MPKICPSCHDSISEKRLAVLPHAALCLTCQEFEDAAIPERKCTNMERLGRTSFSGIERERPYIPRRVTYGTYGLGAGV